jgi:hypothetical protein
MEELRLGTPGAAANPDADIVMVRPDGVRLPRC